MLAASSPSRVSIACRSISRSSAVTAAAAAAVAGSRSASSAVPACISAERLLDPVRHLVEARAHAFEPRLEPVDALERTVDVAASLRQARRERLRRHRRRRQPLDLGQQAARRRRRGARAR